MQAPQAPGGSPRPSTGRVWTPRRRLLGNVIPGVVVLPFLALGLVLLVVDAQDRGDLFGRGLVVFALSIPAGWLAVNLFGLAENERIRRELTVLLSDDGALGHDARFFVGFASPSYASMIDPYEDVGFLVLHPDRLEFVGDSVHVSVKRSQITSIHLRPNLHTALGLGCWVCVDGRISDHPIRMQVALREKRTLLGNVRLAPWLRERLPSWWKSPGSDNQRR